INPLLFDVSRDEVLIVGRGEVAVTVSTIGKDPSQDVTLEEGMNKLKDGVERYVVSTGYRGIQREVLGPGTYYLNKLAFTPHIIPTTNITIDWAMEKWLSAKPANTTGKPQTQTQMQTIAENASTEYLKSRTFNPLTIVSKDG